MGSKNMAEREGRKQSYTWEHHASNWGSRQKNAAETDKPPALAQGTQAPLHPLQKHSMFLCLYMHFYQLQEYHSVWAQEKRHYYFANIKCATKHLEYFLFAHNFANPFIF